MIIKTIITLIIVIILSYGIYHFTYDTPRSELYRECIDELGKDNFTVVNFYLKEDQYVNEKIIYYNYTDEAQTQGVACKPNNVGYTVRTRK